MSALAIYHSLRVEKAACRIARWRKANIPLLTIATNEKRIPMSFFE
jgi:hypothetical protein